MRLVNHAASEARRRGIPFHIVWQDVYPAVLAGRCELTGILFRPRFGNAQKNPFAASLDRKDSSEAYVRGNVRVVLWAINCALGPWGEDVFAPIARAYLEKRNDR